MMGSSGVNDATVAGSQWSDLERYGCQYSKVPGFPVWQYYNTLLHDKEANDLEKSSLTLFIKTKAEKMAIGYSVAVATE